MKLPFRRACLALTLSVAVAGGVAAPANAGLQAPVAQPRGVEDFSGYFPQVSCSPVLQPGVVKFRNLALRTYQRGHDGGITRSCVQGGLSEHKEGRAWDWMLDVGNRRDRRVANNFLSWLTAKGRDGEAGYQARRLGVMYVIWNRRIWSAYRSGEGWRPYSGYSPHTDHIHVSFNWAGARGRTSFWTGRVAGTDYGRCSLFAGQPAVLASRTRSAACPSPSRLVRRSSRATEQLGSTDSVAMKLAQSRLGIARTGQFDTATWTAVKRYQRRNDLPLTGALDQPTWTSMLPRFRTWQATRGF
ncbi:MAG TPA: peptidoglycan-binding domain-containing protein, partial [Nocardioidaceae bacterium]|nr:peptidoglycan-binding domain-containing protein [Nocardioidaceae bacterium]